MRSSLTFVLALVLAVVAGAGRAIAQEPAPPKHAGPKSEVKKSAPAKLPVKAPPPRRPRATIEALRLSAEELLLRGKDPLQRESAAMVLGVRGSVVALPALRQALSKDGNKWVRTRAAEALGMIGDIAAAPWLQSALATEKEPRVRRTIGEALVRLGQGTGVKELVWQLKSGNNNTKAEVMLFLVAATGQPLGQDVDAWWDFFNERGGSLSLARRPTGSPALLPLRGVLPDGAPKGAAATPFLHSRKPFGWQQVPAVVLEVGPRREPISKLVLEEHVRARGGIPDGCLVLIRTDWRDARTVLPATPPPKLESGARAPRPMKRPDPIPWLQPDAVAYLLKQAPRLVGVGIDTPTMDAAPEMSRPARDALLAADRLALEAVGDMDRLVASGTRLLMFRQGPGPAVTLLALLP